MRYSNPIRQLVAVSLGLFILAAGSLLLDLDQPEPRGKIPQGSDLGGSESGLVDFHSFELNLGNTRRGQDLGDPVSMIGGSLRNGPNIGLRGMNVDLVTGIARH